MIDEVGGREAFERAAQITPVAYRAQVGSLFQVENAQGAVTLRLADVSEGHVSRGFLQFSLFFHGPPASLLSQGIYALAHETLGTLALFIVPVLGSNHERIVYEACFNRRVAEPGIPSNRGQDA
jgi:hypothetical protein